MASGSIVSFTVTVNASFPGIYDSMATITADQTDLNPANNTATQANTVISPTPAHLSGAGYTNGTFALTVQGIPGSYVLQASPDLTNWTSISTNIVPSLGILQITDPYAGSYQRRYYRISFIVP
jgi:hypothetical protein